MSSHSRLHGSTSYRVPWLFDEESVDVLRFFTCLKGKLMPYIWSQAVAAAREGLPVTLGVGRIHPWHFVWICVVLGNLFLVCIFRYDQL